MSRCLAAVLSALFLCSASALQAQASAYIPTDDAAMPMIEHLIARGTIADPSPMVRPLLRNELVLSLQRAASASGGAGAPELQVLLARFAGDTAGPWWEAGGVASEAGQQ